MKKVALIIAHSDFQATEYQVPRDILKQNNIRVITVSNRAGTAIAKDGTKVNIDMTLDDFNPGNVDGLFLIGGPGAMDNLDTQVMHELLQIAEHLKKVYGAICIAPRILARAGVLTDKRATGWDGDKSLKEYFDRFSVKYDKSDSVIVDENIITATGPEAAKKFALAILEALAIY